MFFSKIRNVNPPPLLGSHQRVLDFGTSGMRSESALFLSLVERGPVCKEWCNEFIQTRQLGTTLVFVYCQRWAFSARDLVGCLRGGGGLKGGDCFVRTNLGVNKPKL